ncbi:MAG TPA: amidohydrolase [Pyrinomonadaceae bacterium]|nr:amidohydrolase [Pyrinomonadaceae bacterium]
MTDILLNRTRLNVLGIAVVLSALTATTVSAQQSLDAMVDREITSLVATYKMLHASPELSHREEKTSAFFATQLRALGYTVTEHIGKYDRPGFTGYGVVAVMKNGDGPTVLVRTDLDALPVEEKTGLPYASTVKAKNDAGQDVGVMHACGHDIHITNMLGTAKVLAQLKEQWHGTLVLIGQPAEETVDGARAMLADGLYTRFPKPDFAIALHDSADVEAGRVVYCPGYAMASSTSIDVVIRGLGGHGSKPEATKDPIVMAAEIILQLQTIVSRENSPLDPAVVTVGSIHGGTKRNIIPDEVTLQLTTRTFKEDVRLRIIASIERIAKGVALAAGVPEDRAPIIKVVESENAPALYNDPKLTERVTTAIGRAIGTDNVTKVAPLMGSEDFGRFSLDRQIPAFMFWLGAIEPSRVEASRKSGKPLPSLHSSLFEPLPEPTLRTGVRAMTAAVLELMKK